jgi:16S rRNA (cytosine1402-N4)-methyltransferase
LENNLEIPHLPVLLDEVVSNFQTEKSGYFIDATLGYGGHSSAILESSPNLKLIGIDKDITAIEFSKKRLAKFGNRVEFFHGSFSEVVQELIKTKKPILGVLADIGVSSLQFDKLERGFSFDSDNLDMRMNQTQDLTAEKIVNQYSEYDLDRIFKDYGEMRNSRKIAKLIVETRPIESGRDLSSLIVQVEFRKGGGTHPATQLFQAIRIEVNSELLELENLLEAVQILKNVKIGIISFHSLEDRIVKNKFKEWTKSCICPSEAFRCSCGDNHNIGKVLTKKPLVASKQESSKNRRSRSAKLRIFQIGD